MTKSRHPPLPRRSDVGKPTTRRTWPAYAAAASFFLFAAVSAYLAAGGRVGLNTLGGSIERQALARDPVFITVVWITAGLKLGAGLLALALVQPWGRRLPQRPLRLIAWCGAALLVVYGLLQVTSVALIALGVVTPADPPPNAVLAWRLLLWEPWFALCGLLLGLAVRLAPNALSV